MRSGQEIIFRLAILVELWYDRIEINRKRSLYMSSEIVQINDVPAEADSLGMNSRYKGIADFIQSCSTPMTLAIQGDWGTGKTSAMKLIRSEIARNANVENPEDFSIWFNTWQFTVFKDGDKLIVDLMNMMLSQLKKLSEKQHIECEQTRIRLQDKFNTIADNCGRMIGQAGISAIKQFVPGAEIVCDVVDAVAKKENKSCPKGEEIPPTIYITQLRDRINDLIDEILKATGYKRLYIFVDDLDRLEPRVALELLEGMKNFTDYENCVFILAVDQDVVERGLKNKYGNDFSEDKARKFFDKIIQVPFALPVQAYDLKSFISPLLGEHSGNDELIKTYVSLLMDFDVRNPRTIKRSFNLLELYKCMELAGAGDQPMKMTAEMMLKRYAILLLQLEMPGLHQKMTSIADKYDAQTMYEKFRELLQKEQEDNFNALFSVMRIFYGEDYDPDAETEDDAKTQELGRILEETQEMLVPVEERRDFNRIVYADFLKQLCKGIRDRVTLENPEAWDEILNTRSEKLASAKKVFELRCWGDANIPISITWNERKPSPNLTIYAPLDPEMAFDGLADCFYNIKTEHHQCAEDKLGYYYYDSERPRMTVVLTEGRNTLEHTIRLLENFGILTATES